MYVEKVPAERLMAGVGPLIDYFFPEPVLVIELKPEEVVLLPPPPPVVAPFYLVG